MRLVRRHGKAMLLHQKWKLGAALVVGSMMVVFVILAETHSRYFASTQLPLEEVQPHGARRLFYPDPDAVIGRYNGAGKEDDNGYYINAPASRKIGILVHIIGTFYMLVGLNTVCDVYFCGALDEMVEKWNVKPDVAGATFMAAGGSAPELFTSIIGAVGTESDVGFGTIVGSAVFNVLAVIGCCGMVAEEPIKLTWWPLFRDCTYYIFGLCLLAIFAYGKAIDLPDGSKIGGGQIKLYEAVILFVAYLIYCMIMVFNEKLEAKLSSMFDKARSSKVTPEASGDLQKAGEGDAAPGPPDHHVDVSGGEQKPEEKKPLDENPVASAPAAADANGAAKKKHCDKDGHHISEKHLRRVEHKAHTAHHHVHTHENVEKAAAAKAAAQSAEKTAEKLEGDEKKEGGEEEPAEKAEESGSEETDDIEALVKLPDGSLVDKISWALCTPIYVPLYYLIPRPGPKWFLATFGIALLFIAGYSYFLVYCVQMFGYAILGGERSEGVNIVLSFTVLAAGTSIPDLVSSMAVARAGEGDMAVSSSIGSNIFDILVGLPLPWILKIAIVEGAINGNSDYGIAIKSPYIAMYVFLLLFMVACVILSILMNKWYLNKVLGVMMSGLYVVFLGVVLPVELINKGPYL